MSKSSYAEALDVVQKATTTLLRPVGFKQKGRTYNRVAGDGLIHVVNLQMGQYPIGNYVIPGIRESFYGKFAVNLGVYLPCVWELEHGPMTKHFCPEYHCEIRERLGALAHEGRDYWWSLDTSTPHATGELVVNLMRDFGLPFLDTYADYAAVLTQFRKVGRLPFHPEGRNMLAVAIIYHHTGQSEEANRFFSRAIDDARAYSHPGFSNHVRDMRERCGL